MEERVIKSISLDHNEFSVRRSSFLDEEVNFKTGFVKHGVLALNLLLQMYRIKVFKLHLKKDKQEAMNFVDEIDALRGKIHLFIRQRDEQQPDPNYLGTSKFNELDNEFDSLIAKYYEIEEKCGI